MGGRNPGPSSTTQQNAGPPEFQEGYLKDIFARAQGLYQGAPLQYGPSRVAGFNPTELAAQQGALNYAAGGATDIANQAAGGLKFALGDVLNPETNPNLAKYAEGATRPVFQQLRESVLPGIRDAAGEAGAMGSSRQGIAEGLATQGATQQAMDTSSRIYSDAYNRGLQTFETGLQLSPTVQAMGLQPFNIASGVGAQQRALAQAQKDEAANKFQFEQYEPYMRLAQYLGFVGGSYGGQGTSTTEGSPSFWDRIGLGGFISGL